MRFSGLWKILTIAVVCYSLQDVKDAQCLVLCQSNNHTSGRSDPKDPKGCICEDKLKHEELIYHRVPLGTFDPKDVPHQRRGYDD